ncbi:hypothetical protein HPB50_027970 [Hyalomma asiaticum]|nr:hypothetical protein HPB50_027970 [Hyalomma asiaticum]
MVPAVDMGVPSCSRRKRLIDGSVPAFSEGSPALKTPSSMSLSASRDETGDDVSQNKALMYVIPDGRCSCEGRRKSLFRLADCDLIFDTGLKTIACLYNTMHLARATRGNRHQSVVMWRGIGRSLVRSAEEQSTRAVEPGMITMLEDSGSVAPAEDSVDVLVCEQRIGLRATPPCTLNHAAHSTQLHSEDTCANGARLCTCPLNRLLRVYLSRGAHPKVAAPKVADGIDNGCLRTSTGRDSGSPSSEEDWLRIVTSSAKKEQLRALQRAHEIADQAPLRRMSLRRRGGWSTSEKVGPSPLLVAPAFRIAPGIP